MRKVTLSRSNVFVVGQADLPLSEQPIALAKSGSGAGRADKQVWRWGLDNDLPTALAMLARSSTTHRRIINDKADYISASGFSVDDSSPRTVALVECANGQEQSLRAVIQRVALDHCLLGNAFLEVVTDSAHSFLSLYHQDATRCRLAREGNRVMMHHNWRQFRASEAVSLPLYPTFEPHEDGTLRSMVHYKSYEPMFEHYGVPKYIAGLGATAIAYKTDRWNISRLDNAFQPSGVMVLDGDAQTEQEATQIARLAEERFAGKPGQVMFLVKNGVEGDTTKFVPLSSSNDADWKSLHDQALSDIIVAHSWFRTLSGMEYATGFSAERVRHEYNIALSTLIRVEQEALIEPIRQIIEELLHESASSLAFVNRPPFELKPGYMRVWEARKADGLEYDPADPSQQLFLAQI